MNNLEDDKSNIFTIQKQVELALISWSLKKYSYKLINENSLNDKSRPLKSNLAKLEQFLNSLNISIIDYTNQKYNEGMNLDVIDTVKTDTEFDKIKETIEPSIVINGVLVKRARVIKEISRSENE